MAFIQKFRSMFKRRPNTTNMHGYTSAKALIAAMENVVSGGKTLTGPHIRQALFDLDLTLPMEHLVFDQKGDPRYYRHVVVQIQKGKLEVVYPKNRATSKAVFPMPTWEQRK
jgi:branched-chain amino acid transport system substrate-binding protein